MTKNWTVNQLAKEANVSVRTLHHYDQIGLLKAQRDNTNNYRFYVLEDLFILQQIILYRSMDMPLEKVKSIIQHPNFEIKKALKDHKNFVKEQIKQKQKVIRTIEKTIKKLDQETYKNIKLKGKDMFAGLTTKQTEYEKYIEELGAKSKELLVESKRRTKNWQKSDSEAAQNDFTDIHSELVLCLEDGLSVENQRVQGIIDKHFKVVSRFYTPTKEIYIGLGEMYKTHGDFRRNMDKLHKDLAKYLAKAMCFWAENHKW